MMAEQVGISGASIRRIWHKNGLKPHLVKTFKVSNDPQFAGETRNGSSRSEATARFRSALHSVPNEPESAVSTG
jgi:hypothetical protein